MGMDIAIGQEVVVFQDVKHHFSLCHFVRNDLTPNELLPEINRILKVWHIFPAYKTVKNCRQEDLNKIDPMTPDKELDYVFYNKHGRMISFWDSKTRVLYA